MRNRGYILSAAHILDAVASFLVMQRMAVLKEDDLEVRLDRYILENFHKPIRIPDISKALGVGKTTLYKLAHKNYGRGLADQIRYLRIEKAKDLLQNHPDMPLAEVATACGYSDYNYFISVFTREAGTPPRQFRKNRKEG